MSADLLHLTRGSRTATFAVAHGVPVLVHFGDSHGTLPDTALFAGLVPPGGLDAPALPTLVTDPSIGWFGEPGIVLTRDGAQMVLDLGGFTVDTDGTTAEFRCTDTRAGVELCITATLAASGALVLSARVTNTGNFPLGVHSLALTVPVPGALDQLVTWGGRHTMEFCEERTNWGRSVVSVASRHGRTSHQHAPTVFAVNAGTSESRGDAVAVHLAWSGNHRIVCDSVSGDCRTVTTGELLAPGEIVLGPGHSYATPDVLVATGSGGMSSASSAFHRHLRMNAPARRGPRPVIVNTWEAVYFDHDAGRLWELAERAARVGAERFVLDDGWFRGRRDDTAGLGDWEIDTDVWPDGLAPLAGHVTSLGMEFGLWFEPEMVNPDSELYRSHPEWVLGEPHQHSLTGRNQLVLDLARDDVRAYLFARIDAILASLPVSYVKWDHNRDLVAPGAHHRTMGLYSLLADLRAAHPTVEFESCASGGGRIDAGIARHASRFWTSDSIDALDRLSIQRGALRVIPPEMLGAHIGSPVCHTTGRKHSLSFRALSALPFWLGIEWNLLSATEAELDGLAGAVAEHKRLRDLFHNATTVFGDHPDPAVHVHAAVNDDASGALVVIALTANGPRHMNAPVQIPGLDPASSYECRIVPLGHQRWSLNRGLPTWVVSGVTATGAQLASIGLPWPPLLPESGVLVEVTTTR